MTDSASLPRLPDRIADSHKGDYGRALLIGGSRGMAGAIGLAGMATLRSGAGLVTLAVPDVCLDIVAAYEPSYMTLPLLCDEAGRLTDAVEEQITSQVKSATAVAFGPGLGQSESLCTLAAKLHTSLSQTAIFDADGLNALAKSKIDLAKHTGPRILTPHPGEFDRLVGKKLSAEVREPLAIELAAAWNAIIVLKSHKTLVTDGEQTYHNTTGNPGMATGGSGDVLTGVITALVCQGLEPFAAAQLGCHVHGKAGDLAAAEKGQVSLIARDLIDYLSAAFQSLR